MYYNLKSTPHGYRMVKFDALFNVEAVYHIRRERGRFYCDCPAYRRPDCKHREMIPMFHRHRAVDSGRFLHYDRQQWHPPVNDAQRV